MKIKYIVKRYKVFILLLIVLLILTLIKVDTGKEAINITLDNIWKMLKLVPPVFLLLGLMDVWIPKEKFIKHMGNNSGIKGLVLSFIIGSVAAGPLYAAFPIAAVLLKKGTKFFNVMIFIGAWSTTKIPMLLVEGSSLGWKFTITRLVINIVGIISIAFVVDKGLCNDEKEEIYLKANDL